MKKTILIALVSSLLVACGGGSQSTPEAPTPTDPPTKPAPVTPPVTVAAPEYKGDFVAFESAPVRPIALTDNGSTILLTNTSNASLEIFHRDQNGTLSHQHSIKVGLEPVAVAVHNQQAWVVNHLSDSVSIVDLSAPVPYVTRTLLVGDEPRDIVFAKNQAFITTAHRGQQRLNPTLSDVTGAGSPQLHTPSVGRTDIWVFNSQQLGQTLGGKPRKIITLFGDTARALAVNKQQTRVYVAVFNSGNQTSVAHEAVLCHGFEDDAYGAVPCQVLDEITSPNGLANAQLPGGRTAPGVNSEGMPQPWTSMIVKYDRQSGQWQDSKGRNFSNAIRFNLPDNDVFAIDTNTLTQVSSYQHVGTTLFNMAVSARDNTLFVTNTEANNRTRFEGGGEFGGSTVQGNIARTQITVIDLNNHQVKPRAINRHINYQQLKASNSVKQHTLSTPNQTLLNDAGDTLYTAMLGSNKIAVHPVNQLTNDALWDNQGDEFQPQSHTKNHFNVEGGPMGIALDDANHTLYAFTRFDNALVAINSQTGEQLQRIGVHNPEPHAFQAGRFMLYDATRSSSNGESSCASCHIYGDTDHLSWNLGNPDSKNSKNPQPFPTEHLSKLGCLLVGENEASCQLLEIINGNGDEYTFAAMKGPMTTQTMRGMSTHGHMHWRGDRSVGYFGTDTAKTLNERTSFKNFIVAFEGLLGLDIELPKSVNSPNKSPQVTQLEKDMDHFADFMLNVSLPPNPIRALDNSLSASAQMGADFFHGDRRSDGAATDTPLNGDSPDGVNCQGCHGVDHSQGFYGTRGEIAHGGEIQILKVPQLRNLYTRVGMFGLPDRQGFLPSHTKQHQGDQIRGFGFLHDGATDQLLNFLKGGVFDNGELGCPKGADERHGCHFNAGEIGIPDEPTRQGLVDYMMEFDNDLAPIVGQQITLNVSSNQAVHQRIELLLARANTAFTAKILGGETKECELVATGIINGAARGYFYQAKPQTFRPDSATETPLSLANLKALASEPNNSLTFTCTVVGKGWQMALDEDENGILNFDQTEKG